MHIMLSGCEQKSERFKAQEGFDMPLMAKDTGAVRKECLQP